jgi:hypothetical protein
MDSFKGNLKTYLESIVQSAQKAMEAEKKVNKEL